MIRKLTVIDSIPKVLSNRLDVFLSIGLHASSHVFKHCLTTSVDHLSWSGEVCPKYQVSRHEMCS